MEGRICGATKQSLFSFLAAVLIIAVVVWAMGQVKATPPMPPSRSADFTMYPGPVGVPLYQASSSGELDADFTLEPKARLNEMRGVELAKVEADGTVWIRQLKAGRLQSAKAGKFLGGAAPGEDAALLLREADAAKQIAILTWLPLAQRPSQFRFKDQ